MFSFLFLSCTYCKNKILFKNDSFANWSAPMESLPIAVRMDMLLQAWCTFTKLTCHYLVFTTPCVFVASVHLCTDWISCEFWHHPLNVLPFWRAAYYFFLMWKTNQNILQQLHHSCQFYLPLWSVDFQSTLQSFDPDNGISS